MKEPRIIRKARSRAFPRRLPRVEVRIPRIVGIMADAWWNPIQAARDDLAAQGYQAFCLKEDPRNEVATLVAYEELVRP